MVEDRSRDDEVIGCLVDGDLDDTALLRPIDVGCRRHLDWRFGTAPLRTERSDLVSMDVAAHPHDDVREAGQQRTDLVAQVARVAVGRVPVDQALERMVAHQHEEPVRAARGETDVKAVCKPQAFSFAPSRHSLGQHHSIDVRLADREPEFFVEPVPFDSGRA